MSENFVRHWSTVNRTNGFFNFEYTPARGPTYQDADEPTDQELAWSDEARERFAEQIENEINEENEPATRERRPIPSTQPQSDPESAASADQWIARLPPVPSIIPTRSDSVPQWVAEINRNNIFGSVRRRLPNGQSEEITADTIGYSRITFATRDEPSTREGMPPTATEVSNMDVRAFFRRPRPTATYDEIVRFEDDIEPATRERREVPSTQPPEQQPSGSQPVGQPQAVEQEEEVEIARIDDEDDPPASNESTIAQYSTSDEENDSFNFGADLH
jgi:hypothetical protein